MNQMPPRDAVNFVSDMCFQLRTIAVAAKQPHLASLLELANLEALLVLSTGQQRRSVSKRDRAKALAQSA